MKAQSVYIVFHPITKYVKIGLTNDLVKAMDSLNSYNGLKLDLMYYTLPCYNADLIERALHDEYVEHRKLGKWFLIDPYIAIEKIKTLDVQLPDIVSDYLSGMSLRDLSMKYNKSRQSIEKMFKKHYMKNNNNVSSVKPVKEQCHKRIKKESIPNDSSISKSSLEEMVKRNQLKMKSKK